MKRIFTLLGAETRGDLCHKAYACHVPINTAFCSSVLEAAWFTRYPRTPKPTSADHISVSLGALCTADQCLVVCVVEALCPFCWTALSCWNVQPLFVWLELCTGVCDGSHTKGRRKFDVSQQHFAETSGMVMSPQSVWMYKYPCGAATSGIQSPSEGLTAAYGSGQGRGGGAGATF